MGKVIVTTFAGRRDRMSILYDYLITALNQNMIDEYHIWDFARSSDDETWLSEIAEIYSTPANEDEFHHVNLSLAKMDHLSIQIKTSLEIKLNLYSPDNRKVVEITINNQRIIARCHYMLDEVNLKNPILSSAHFNEFFILNQGRHLKIQQGEEILVDLPVDFEWNYFEISSKARADWIFNDQEQKVKLFKCLKSAPHWEEYYTYYHEDKYNDDIFIKMDDDLVYLDLDNLVNFIKFRKDHPEFFLVSANVVNNGVCAYYQQNHKAIDRSMMQFPYDTFKGKLWNSGLLAEKLHRYFIHNLECFKYDGYINLPLGDRISINCISWLGCDWKYMHQFNYYDEEQMSQQVPKKLNRSNAIFNRFLVSHLSFYSQDHQMDLKDLLGQYQTLKEYSLKKYL